MKDVLWLVPVIIAMIILGGCGQWAAKQLGGTYTVKLEAGQKLEMITWKQDNLWVLTRARRAGESPERHLFQEKSPVGVMQGTVVLEEQ
jgi:hypothetical protein